MSILNKMITIMTRRGDRTSRPVHSKWVPKNNCIFQLSELSPICYHHLSESSPDNRNRLSELRINLILSPNTAHIDFEMAIRSVVKMIWPTTTMKERRFHLGQAWWRKIQNLDLSKSYKKWKFRNRKMSIVIYLAYFF